MGSVLLFSEYYYSIVSFKREHGAAVRSHVGELSDIGFRVPIDIKHPMLDIFAEQKPVYFVSKVVSMELLSRYPNLRSVRSVAEFKRGLQ